MKPIPHRPLRLALIPAVMMALVACGAPAATDPTASDAPVPTEAAAGTAGQETPAAAGPIEVRIKMTEYVIESSLTTFQTGVPYRFIMDSAGVLAHDFRITPRGESQAMIGMQTDGHAHEHGNELMVVKEPDLPPGAQVTKDITFNQPGEYEFACHVAGHLEAGMLLPIMVTGEVVAMPTPIDPASIAFDADMMAGSPCHAMGLTIMGDCQPEDVERLKADILAKDAAFREKLGGAMVEEDHAHADDPMHDEEAEATTTPGR